jgi:hypothetical protein
VDSANQRTSEADAFHRQQADAAVPVDTRQRRQSVPHERQAVRQVGDGCSGDPSGPLPATLTVLLFAVGACYDDHPASEGGGAGRRPPPAISAPGPEASQRVGPARGGLYRSTWFVAEATASANQEDDDEAQAGVGRQTRSSLSTSGHQTTSNGNGSQASRG